MSGMLDYRGDNALVVEGYAASDSSQRAVPLSQERADLVRSYLLRAYDRPAALTGAMAMGWIAEDSPSGDGSWNGVALSMLVDTPSARKSSANQVGRWGREVALGPDE